MGIFWVKLEQTSNLFVVVGVVWGGTGAYTLLSIVLNHLCIGHGCVSDTKATVDVAQCLPGILSQER